MAGFETAPSDLKPLLSQRISELGKLEGSPIERYVADLYRELEAKGLKRFRPPTYLTDEWGCPDEEPIIGIPFYLADAKLARLEREIDDVEDAREIRMYLRAERQRVAELAIKQRLPTMSMDRDVVEAGGLMSYSANWDDLYRRGALYVDKILKGAQPADLPVEQATTFEFVINLKTAKALGLTIPQSILARADQVIQ